MNEDKPLKKKKKQKQEQGHCSSCHLIGWRTLGNELQCAQAYLLWLLLKIQLFPGTILKEVWKSNGAPLSRISSLMVSRRSEQIDRCFDSEEHQNTSEVGRGYAGSLMIEWPMP